jgi:hypothetical protein
MSLVVSDHLSGEPVGALCVLGRGIERVQARWGAVWRPTRYLEQPSEHGGHSGTRHPAGPSDATALIAGSNATALGACTLFNRLRCQGAAPHMVIFAAGRPAYLADESTLSEGIVLQQAFMRRLGVHARDTEMIILTDNRNTYDDINSTVTLASERCIAQVAIITVGVHIASAMEFGRQAPDIEHHVRLAFITAEHLLRERYTKHPCILRAIEAARTSAAYQRTAAREAHGLQALRTGTYWTQR